MMKNSMNRFVFRTFVAAGLCLVPAMAQPPKVAAFAEMAGKKPTVPNKAAAKQRLVGQSGMVVVKDPEGGLRAPTAAEAQALMGGLSSSATSGGPGPVFTQRGNGLVSVQLGPEQAVFSVVQKGPDGKLIYDERVGLKAASFAVQQGTIDQPKAAHLKTTEKGNSNEQ